MHVGIAHLLVTENTFPAFPAHAHPQFRVSGKRRIEIMFVLNQLYKPSESIATALQQICRSGYFWNSKKYFLLPRHWECRATLLQSHWDMGRIFKNFCRSAVAVPSQVRCDWGITWTALRWFIVVRSDVRIVDTASCHTSHTAEYALWCFVV